MASQLACDGYGFVTVTDGSFNPIPQNPWGTSHSAIGNPWTFTGRQLDEETGLYFYRVRYYDPIKGRFLQRDPVPGGVNTNLYAYVEDRPTFFADPTGLVPATTYFRFWHNSTGNVFSSGNYPVARYNVTMSLNCTQDAGGVAGGDAVVTLASKSESIFYGTGSVNETVTPISCPGGKRGYHVSIKATSFYTPASLRRQNFFYGTFVGFYRWVYDFDAWRASAVLSYNVCCDCCFNTWYPITFPSKPTNAIANGVGSAAAPPYTELAIAMHQEHWLGCPGFLLALLDLPPRPSPVDTYALNATIGEADKALNDQEEDAIITPGQPFHGGVRPGFSLPR